MRPSGIRGQYLIDTNVLVYATFSGDARHRRALEVLEARFRAGNRAFLSAQNLAEMYPCLTGSRADPPDPPGLARAKIAAVGAIDGLTVLPVTRAIVERALALCEAHGVTRQRYFDMQLAASALEEGIPTIVTENVRDFRGIEGLSAVNPFV